MPRMPRRKSTTGCFHVICRGVGKQILFEEERDYQFFLSRMTRFGDECGITLSAYCLMENHVHLLVNDHQDKLSLFMKKMEVSYSVYFNKKYERSGHLFQGRYLSEPIEDEKSLLAVVRYILNNPRKAGICSASAYKWSSYHLFQKPEAGVDTTILHQILGSEEAFHAFIDSDDEETGICNIECETPPKNDRWAIEVARNSLDGISPAVVKSLVREERNRCLRMLKEKGLSLRQIERLTGVSRTVIRRA